MTSQTTMPDLILHRGLLTTLDRSNPTANDHATAWSSRLPIADLKGFWGALGCACWAV